MHVVSCSFSGLIGPMLLRILIHGSVDPVFSEPPQPAKGNPPSRAGNVMNEQRGMFALRSIVRYEK